MVILSILASTTALLLRVVYYAMFIRVILSFFVTEEGPIMALLAFITEPVAAFFRFLLSLFGIGENSPIDWGFFVGMLAISMLQMLLPAV